jgi:hypothetical protein
MNGGVMPPDRARLPRRGHPDFLAAAVLRKTSLRGAGGIRTHTGRILNPVPLPLGYGPAPRRAAGQTPSCWRSRATCPVALTPYSACSMRPSAPTTNVDLITPTDFFPYIIFSP